MRLIVWLLTPLTCASAYLLIAWSIGVHQLAIEVWVVVPLSLLASTSGTLFGFSRALPGRTSTFGAAVIGLLLGFSWRTLVLLVGWTATGLAVVLLALAIAGAFTGMIIVIRQDGCIPRPALAASIVSTVVALAGTAVSRLIVPGI
jgi:hypothetical protein